MRIEKATRKAMEIGGWIGYKNKHRGYTLMKPEEHFKIKVTGRGELLPVRRMEWGEYFENWKVYTTEEARAPSPPPYQKAV